MRADWIVAIVAGVASVACGRLGFDTYDPSVAGDSPRTEAPPDPDLIVHVTFDDATVADIAGLLAPPTCAAGRCPSLQSGRIGNAAQFDGVDDYLEFSSVAALDFGGASQPFSVALWFRATDLTPPIQRVLMAQATDGGQVSYQLSYEAVQSGAALDLVWKVCATGCIAEPSAIAADLPILDRWTLVVATWDGGATIELFVDAERVASAPKPGAGYDGFPFMVGADYETGGSIEDSFAGAIDDLRIYRRVLSVPEQQLLLSQ